jgi:hypothetical protein
MKKVILIIEDTIQHQEAAKKAAAESGYGAIVVATLDDARRMIDVHGNRISGIVTDLHFPENDRDAKPEKPAGLAVIVYAINAHLPIAVCSDINNHYARYAKEIVDFLAPHAVGGEIPFTMNEKSWTQAIDSLTTLILKGGR